MKVLVVLACVAIVAARPEPPVGGYSQHHGGHHGGGHGGHGGYNYAQPAPLPSYPVPTGAVSQFSGSAATASAGGAAFDTLSFGGGGSSGAFSGSNANAFSGSNANAFSQSNANAFAGSNANTFQGSSFGGGQAQSLGFAAPQQQIVQKHIYVHVPPPEPEQSFQQQIVAPGLRQKHYKIIFIKTPHVQSAAAQLALQQSQTEEKTIVYVLVKKPDALGDISLPSPSVSKPSKPEVYFIKYKTNSEKLPLAVGGSSSAVSQANAGLGLLSSSGSASASASGSALGSSGVSHGAPAQAYGAPVHHHGHGGYH